MMSFSLLTRAWTSAYLREPIIREETKQRSRGAGSRIGEGKAACPGSGCGVLKAAVTKGGAEGAVGVDGASLALLLPLLLGMMGRRGG